MAAQQAQRVALAVLLGHPVASERADPGADSVDVLAAGQQLGDRITRGIVAGSRLGCQLDASAVASDRRHRCGCQGGPVQGE